MENNKKQEAAQENKFKPSRGFSKHIAMLAERLVFDTPHVW